jgi:hypothetical protein
MKDVGVSHPVPPVSTGIQRLSDLKNMSPNVFPVFREEDIDIMAIDRLPAIQAKNGADRRKTTQCSEPYPPQWRTNAIAPSFTANPTLQ